MYRINCVLRLFRGKRPWLDLRVGVRLGLRFGGRVLRRPGRIRTCLDVCSRVCTAHARARGGCGIIRRKGSAKARVCRHFFVCQRKACPRGRRRFQRKHLAGGLLQDIRAPGLVFVHEHHAVGFLCFGALRRNEHHPFVYLFIFDAGEVQPAFLDHFIERLEVIVPLARHGDGAHLRGSGVHFDAIPLQERRHVLRAGDLLRKRAALRGRRFEALIGLSVFNKIGVLLIVIGSVAAARFTYTKLPDSFKGGMLFLLAFLFLGVGEWMGRGGRRRDLFSLGLSAGGVALLYVSVVTCFFWLHLLQPYAAFALIVLITALAFFLSQRHNAQVIAAFAMIGGYLPALVFFFQPGIPLPLLLISALYFAGLCLFSLLTACRKKWIAAQFVGFALNTAAFSILAVLFSERTNFYPLETTGLGWLCRLTPCLLVAFSCLAFLAGPLFYARRTQAALKIHDFLLQGCNLMASYVALSLLTGRFPSTNYAFLQPLCFTLLLAGTAGYLWKRVPKERTGLYAAAGAAILFSLLIPLYFSYAYAVYAWTAEALLFLLPGLQGKRRPLELAGWLVGAAAILSLLIAYPMLQLSLPKLAFLPSCAAAYTCVTAASLFPMAVILHRGKPTGGIQSVYPYGFLLNLWLYVIFATQYFLPALIPAHINALHTDLFLLSLTILLGCAVGCLAVRLPRLRDDVTAVIGLLIYACSFLMVHIVNCAYFRQANFFPQAVQIGLVLLQIASNIASVLAAADFTRTLVKRFRAPAEIYPLTVSAAFTVLLTELLLGQFRLAFSNPLISALYLATALGWVLCGFWRRYGSMRRFGLCLSFLALAKLFLLDLAGLSEGRRIVSFFVFGALMLLISFVYRYFSKRMLPNGSIAQIPAQESSSATQK